MTKIEVFNDCKKIYEKVKFGFIHACGGSIDRNGIENDCDSSNDKYDLSVYAKGEKDRYVFNLELSAKHGWYGNSSVTSDMSPELAKYYCMAINAHSKMLAKYAIKIAFEDMEKARKEARKEAEIILKNTK